MFNLAASALEWLPTGFNWAVIPIGIALVALAWREKTRPLRFSVMTSCLVGETHEDAVERGRELYSVRQRPMPFEEWLEAFRGRAVIGSVDEVATQLREYELAGCDRVMLQHLNHRDLESVRKLAHHGYIAICPNLHSRGGPGTAEEMVAGMRDKGGVTDSQAMADGQAGITRRITLAREKQRQEWHDK